MILAPLHPLMLPLAIAIWSVDALLWIVLIRVSLSRIRRPLAREAVWALGALTDPAHRLMHEGISRFWAGRCPSWLSWTALIIVLFVAHHLLLWITITVR